MHKRRLNMLTGYQFEFKFKFCIRSNFRSNSIFERPSFTFHYFHYWWWIVSESPNRGYSNQNEIKMKWNGMKRNALTMAIFHGLLHVFFSLVFLLTIQWLNFVTILLPTASKINEPSTNPFYHGGPFVLDRSFNWMLPCFRDQTPISRLSCTGPWSSWRRSWYWTWSCTPNPWFCWWCCRWCAASSTPHLTQCCNRSSWWFSSSPYFGSASSLGQRCIIVSLSLPTSRGVD